MLPKAPIQRRAREPQLAGSLSDVSAVLVESFHDDGFFNLEQSKSVSRDGFIRFLPGRQKKILWPQEAVVAEYESTFNRVLELPDIPRPVIRFQHRESRL